MMVVPILRVHCRRLTSDSAMTQPPPPLRVLVVEDEFLIRWSINETLTQSGHMVVEAPDGASAVRTLTDAVDPIDLVLLDYRLPDSNDLTLLATIRRLAPHSPVIMMTAFGTPEVIKGALDLGVSQVLNKPFEMHDLPALVRETHRQSR
jgi:DNA-binding response OmpR family regulator